MADNALKFLNSTDVLAKTVASKDVSSVNYERILLGVWNSGGSTVDDVPGDATNGIKVQGTGTFAVTGTFWQATQPISATSLPLPTGAATLAKQPALGTAGTASADVITVQGIASMTALKVDGSAVTQPVSGAFWQSTQPVSIASLPALAAGTNVIGHVIVDSAPTTAVTGSFWQSTQPVSIATAPALVASSAVIGHVIVDSAPTTVVTIATAPALVASSAIIGNVRIDQTTPGTTNAVQLTAGSATVGTVNIGTNGADLTNTTSALATATQTTPLQLAGSGSISVTITLASGSISNLIYQFEASADGTNWVIAPLHPCSTTNGMGLPIISDTKTSLASPVTYAGNVSGFSQFRVNFTTVTGSSPSLTIIQRATIAEFVPRLPVMTISARLSLASGTETSIVAAPGAGLSIYVTGIHGSNASGTATLVDIRDGTGGTIRYSYFLAANGGGFAENLTQPWKLAANAALTAQLGGSNQCYFSANYFVAP